MHARRRGRAFARAPARHPRSVHHPDTHAASEDTEAQPVNTEGQQTRRGRGLFCILGAVWAELKDGASRPLDLDLIWSGERHWVEVEVVVKNKRGNDPLTPRQSLRCIVIVSNSTESLRMKCDKENKFMSTFMHHSDNQRALYEFYIFCSDFQKTIK